ncbi:methyl-accepting chemotaxis protein [Sporolactobacillus shoreicorticis]|uniref:Methyl-accepting chemotaxis protein n=1 Tax=Sporolactobacillus shoreicorticis TaxID=1923877 RepID=A0ABW5S3K8_9BACL|nr:methyl-accepting chemotaxis protein [Sporolactobacillus shoreicorticis]MCO7124250.1 methyl-accepting chemotaxis protein [Sporolactobacillus shoreicorticis]
MTEEKRERRHLSFTGFMMIFLIVVIVIPNFFFGMIIVQQVKKSSQVQLDDHTTNNIKLLNKNLNQFIDGKIYMVTKLSGQLTSDIDSVKLQAALGNIQRADQDQAALYLANRKGELAFFPSSVKIPKSLDPRTRPWYKQAMEHPGQLIITSPYRSSDGSNVMTVTIAQTTKDSKGVIGMDLKLNKIKKLVNQAKVGATGYVSLLDRENKWVVNKKGKIGTKADDLFVKQLASNKSKPFVYHDQKVYSAINSLTGWRITGNVNVKDINGLVNPLTFTIILSVLVNLIIVILLTVWLVRNYVTKPLKKMVTVFEKVSNNDLTEELDTTSMKTSEELAQLGWSTNKMIDSLKGIVHTLSSKSELLTASSEELTASTEESKATTDEIAHSIEQIAGAANQQASGIKRLTTNAQSINQSIASVTEQMSQLARRYEDSRKFIDNGQETVDVTNNQMAKIKQTVTHLAEMVSNLSKQSQEINAIIHVINDVASQTQLLSLNASIEAARAGEYGKGFAVVATEIQKLSVQSSENADRISSIIATIQEDTEKVVQSMNTGIKEVDKGIHAVKESDQSFDNIETFVSNSIVEIEKISKIIRQIAESTEEATAAYRPIEVFAEQASEQTQGVSAATEEQSASVGEMARSATELSSIADELNQIVQTFQTEK